MRFLSERTFVLLASLLVTIAVAWAAGHRLSSRKSPTQNDQQILQEPAKTQPSPSQSTAEAVGPITRIVIAGGGGASTGGNFRVDGTIGEVGASNTMSGGSFTLSGGYWNTLSNPAASPSPTPTSSPTPPSNVAQFASSSYSVPEGCTTLTIVVNRVGDTSGAASVEYFSSDISTSERRDYITAIGTLRFAPGETASAFSILINDDSYVEGSETFTINLRNPVGMTLGSPQITTVTIVDNAAEPNTNVIDDPRNYVCQQYHDFLNRHPDQAGWDFWTNEIVSCGGNQACVEVKRVNVSAAFYLSIEFQQTGYLVERLYKTAYGNASGASTFNGTHQVAVPMVRFDEFMADVQQIGQGVVVLQSGWEQQLENNKQAFTAQFVQRSRFTTAFPDSMTAAQFVDVLNANAGTPLAQSERNQLVTDLSTNAKTRAQVLRAIAEDTDLVNAEFNRAFVLMQYFGYLRRNPNDPQDTDYTGYDFWLLKLDAFNGNYIDAEMVKGFMSSIEYRARFGP